MELVSGGGRRGGGDDKRNLKDLFSPSSPFLGILVKMISTMG